MLIAAIPWCILVAGFVFLFAIAWRNGRTGYRRPLVRVSLVAEGRAWLQEIKGSLSAQTQPVQAPPLVASRDATAEQLARLGLALQVNRSPPVVIAGETKSHAPASEIAEVADRLLK
jgi:hypothetical protein